jgi:transcriptional regulator with XRE-family HTH domain
LRKSIHSREGKALVRLLAELRRNAGFTQEELAKRLKMPQSFVSKYEAGERRVDLVELRRIALILGVSLPELVNQFEKILNETK